MEQNRRPSMDDPMDVLFETLSVERRRQALEFLRLAEGGTAPLAAVTDHVCAGRSGNGAESREQVLNQLHHTDLPKMDSAGLISYDARETTARIRERANGDRPPGAGSGIDSWDDLLERLRALSVGGDGAR